ncbi:hypothetical protein EVAR_102691_1 [Eumeta japonica]|uniref:Uncharacterized protein n=1 Tax=Eumeta variegata TaxID=151549 RepID=A0A4C1THJ7_EUMVA|nr:hypothetical protein EVAR_102691_1 [Eumeta japonica]
MNRHQELGQRRRLEVPALRSELKRTKSGRCRSRTSPPHRGAPALNPDYAGLTDVVLIKANRSHHASGDTLIRRRWTPALTERARKA